MDDELKQRLVKYLDGMENAVKTGGDFVYENAPETIRQYITYTIASNAAAVIGGAILLCFGIYVGCNLAKYLRKFGERYYESNPVRVVIQAIVSAICCVFGPISAATHVDPLLKVWLAPNIYIIETIAKLVK